MNVSDLTIPAYFTTDGNDIWELKSFYSGPSCTLENLKTGDKQNFGIGGLTAQNFHKIQMPEIEESN